MKNYKQFILESADVSQCHIDILKGYTDMKPEQAESVIKNFCDNDPNVNIKRYVRGISVNYLHINTEVVKRKSRDCKNTYTLLFDNLPSWKDFPKRSKSLICSLMKAKFPTGIEYKVYPYKGSVWGVCPNYDIWWSFPKIKKEIPHITLDILIYNLNLLYGDVNKDEILDDENYEILVEQLNSIKPKLESYENPYAGLQNTIDFLLKNEGTTVEILEKLLDPIENGFKVVKYEDLHKLILNELTDLEIWTESECVLKNYKLV